MHTGTHTHVDQTHFDAASPCVVCSVTAIPVEAGQHALVEDELHLLLATSSPIAKIFGVRISVECELDKIGRICSEDSCTVHLFPCSSHPHSLLHWRGCHPLPSPKNWQLVLN